MRQLKLFPSREPRRKKKKIYRVAKYISVCKLCGRYIRPGQTMVWYGRNHFERPWVYPKCEEKQ